MTQKFMTLCVLSVLGLVTPASAVTVTITNPSNNAAVLCNVRIRATVNYGGRVQAAPPKVYIENSSGQKVVDGASMDQIDATTFEYDWWTPNHSNDGSSHPFTIEVHASHTSDGMQDGQTTVSNLVNVTARNGYRFKSATAVVNSPTANQVFGLNQSFRLETSHEVVWERFDDCQDIVVSYRFMQFTNQTSDHSKEIGNNAFVIPKVIGDYPTERNNWAHTYINPGPVGNYTAYAWTQTPIDNTRASDSKNYSAGT